MGAGGWAAWGSGEPLPAGWRAVAVGAVAGLLVAAPWTEAAGGMDFAARVLLLAVLASAQELVTGRGGAWLPTIGPCAVLGGLAATWPGSGWLQAATLAAALVLLLTLHALLVALTWRAGRRLFSVVALLAALGLPALAAQLAGTNGDASAVWPESTGPARFAVLAVFLVALWLLLLRWANSPFGRVLRAWRENPLLAETLGFRPSQHRAIAVGMAVCVATLAGAALALWQNAAPSPVAGSLDLMLQVLLVALVGGLGTMWAAPVGAVVVLAAWSHLPALLVLGAGRVPDVPWLAHLLSDPATQRWLMAALIALAGWMAGGLMARSNRT